MATRYKAIVDELAVAIRHGLLPAGSQLPTHRQLAKSRRISLATATRIYSELSAMGLVSGETGRGTFVRDISLPEGLGIDQQMPTNGMLDLNFNHATLSYQTGLLREALRQLTTSGELESLLRYQPHAGRVQDREIIAHYLASADFTPSPGSILIVNGAQHGLAVVAMGLLKPGDVVAVDALTYPGFKALARTLHLDLVSIPIYQNAPDLLAFAQLCRERSVKAIYCMPTLHNPLGWVLTRQQRQKIAAIARQHHLLIIEDTAYAYLVRHAPPPLAYFAPERTLYITSFSKNLAAGLRIGAIVSPRCYYPTLERVIRTTTWNTPALITRLVCQWLQDGTARRLEILKRRDARQRQRLAKALLAPLHSISHANSYFIWLPLTDEVRSETIVKRLVQQNISVSTAEPFSVSHNTPHAIRLALGSIPLDILQQTLIKIRDIILHAQYE